MSRTPSIAVIGAGTTGLYIADQLMCQGSAFHIDLIDIAPSPAGIAPFAQTAVHSTSAEKNGSTTHFVGNVVVGRDITREELNERYDAVIDTTTITESVFAANAALGIALHALTEASDAPQITIDLAEFLVARGVPATKWNNPLDLPTGQSFEQWAGVIRAAHGTPVCF